MKKTFPAMIFIAAGALTFAISPATNAKDTRKSRQFPLETKIETLGAQQLKLLQLQERELQYLREILQQLKQEKSLDRLPDYPYSYP